MKKSYLFDFGKLIFWKSMFYKAFTIELSIVNASDLQVVRPQKSKNVNLFFLNQCFSL